jgi:hypothetical protein
MDLQLAPVSEPVQAPVNMNVEKKPECRLFSRKGMCVKGYMVPMWVLVVVLLLVLYMLYANNVYDSVKSSVSSPKTVSFSEKAFDFPSLSTSTSD